jgi:hypothetical protein
MWKGASNAKGQEQVGSGSGGCGTERRTRINASSDAHSFSTLLNFCAQTACLSLSVRARGVRGERGVLVRP